MTFFGKFLEKCWHNPQIFKSRYRSRNSSLESRIFWWSLALVILTRSLSRSLGLGYISGRYSDSIERVWGYTSKACKYKKRKRNVGHDDFLLNCNTGCKKHPAYRSLILTASRFSQALLQVSFTNKWWFSSIDVDRAAKGAMPPKCLENIVILCFVRRFSEQNSASRLKSNISPTKNFGLATPLLSSKVKTWNFTKCKLLKLANSMKIDFLFSGSNLNTFVRKLTQDKCTSHGWGFENNRL